MKLSYTITIDLSGWAPVLLPLAALAVRGWYAVRTWGMSPFHPDASRIALRRQLLLADLEKTTHA